MSDPTPIGALKREHHLLFLDASFGGQSPSWFLIGKHIGDLSVELNPDVSTIKNILGETVADDNGYEPSVGVDTYYANTSDAIYPQLLDIALDRKTGEDCKTKYLEVVIDTVEGPHKAWMEDCIVKPQSYGGAPAKLNIPYKITPDGNRVKGTATLSNRVPTFTPAS